jgi:phage tail-like protein
MYAWRGCVEQHRGHLEAAMPGEAYPVCRFYLEIGGKKEAVFTQVGAIRLEMTPQTLEEGGQNDFVHQLPGPAKVSNLTLKRGLTRSNEFCQWYMSASPGSLQRKNVTLTLYDVDGKPLQRWVFRNAYPVKWISPDFDASSSTVAIESLELAHEGMSLG